MSRPAWPRQRMVGSVASGHSVKDSLGVGIPDQSMLKSAAVGTGRHRGRCSIRYPSRLCLCPDRLCHGTEQDTDIARLTGGELCDRRGDRQLLWNEPLGWAQLGIALIGAGI